MTPVQIAYFKHFMFDKGIQAIYISMYRRNRIKSQEGEYPPNPESLEEFLQQQPIWRVIMHAFYFLPNSSYGYDYWDDINKKWKKYWDIHSENFNNDKYVTMKGTFAILRQNWDSEKYWKPETMEASYKRMNIEPPIDTDDIEKALAVPRASLNSYGNAEYTEEDLKEEEKEVVVINPVQQEEAKPQTNSLLEGFSLVDTVNPVGGCRMSANTVSINLRNGGYRMTFSTKVSEKLRKQLYKFVKLLTKRDTKEIALVFNHQSGCRVTIRKSTDESRNVTINSKDIVEHIHKFYGMKKIDDYFLLEITDTIQQDTNIIFKLKLKE